MTQSELDAATIPAGTDMKAHTELVPLAVAQQLMRERDEARDVIRQSLAALENANEIGLINDTLWYSPWETLFDFMASATEQSTQQDQTQSRLNDAAAHSK